MNIKERMLLRENYYSPYATKDKESIRITPIEEDIRPNFFRDIDRIIHSASYTRYMDKTQVFSLKDNDNISKRMVHVQLVSKIARTIGRALSLNEDLIEAAALGHDLGHVPFGHEGERILNKISLKHNEGYFNHNVQSVRELMDIENEGEGINLSVQTLDAILCHNGELELKEYYPKTKTTEEFLQDYENCYKIDGYTKTLIPNTLEGCVVRISDIIAYLGRDIEDAERLNLIKKEDLPKEITDILGSTNKEIVNTLIMDIINNSIDKPYLKMSDDIFEALKKLKKFNYENIYSKANTKEELAEYENMFESLFNHLLKDVKNNNTDSNIYKIFIKNKNEKYRQNTPERIVIDYIAGMTDDFFLKEYKKYEN
ncbi:MAG: HD domain-containing protein [bacterium]|nr:HD domain-containing protein [bacterium]